MYPYYFLPNFGPSSESTRDTYHYGQYVNQFPQNTIKVIREFERIQKKICRHKMSIMFNEICINEEMLPKYTYICIYIYNINIFSPKIQQYCKILISDPAELSNKKCTCLNNRCMRSKISGDNLTVDGLSWVQMRRSLRQGTSKNYITWCDRKSVS